MGGPPCKTDEERRLRRNASSLKNYHKHKNDPGQKEKHLETGRQASLKYYHNNKDKCVQHVYNWKKNNPETYKRIQQKAYYKKKGKIILFIKKSSIEKP